MMILGARHPHFCRITVAKNDPCSPSDPLLQDHGRQEQTLEPVRPNFTGSRSPRMILGARHPQFWRSTVTKNDPWSPSDPILQDHGRQERSLEPVILNFAGPWSPRTILGARHPQFCRSTVTKNDPWSPSDPILQDHGRQE
jgi:hypothetical protein